MAEPDWSRLPYDLVSTIANRLSVIEDFLAFSGVCRSWRSVYWNRNWTPGPQFPWLMLSDEKDNDGSRVFFSFYKNTRLLSTLPEAHGRRCWGSPWGWLLTIGLDFEIHLLNPITRVRMDLPPQSTFHRLTDADTIDDCECFRVRCIHKAYVLRNLYSSSRKTQEELLVLAIHGPHYHLALARPGYDAWIAVESESPLPFRDVAMFNGQIYAICGEGTLHKLELDDTNPPRAIQIAEPPTDDWVWQQMYLVESSGELLFLFRCVSRSVVDFLLETFIFHVYKFDFGANSWTEVDTLGDRSLFVGDNCSMSICASEVANCKPNCIYFTEDKVEMWPIGDHDLGRCDTGVYSMESKSIEPLNFGENVLFHYSAPIWITPSIW